MNDYIPQNFLILAVDDNPVNCILIEKILKKEGYKTKVISDSELVMSCIEEEIPDLLLLDLMMPKINGIELCRQIKLNPLYQEIPVIFITASSEKQDLLEAFNSGAVDYVTKPFHNQELLARIKTHLELKSTRDELKKALIEVEKLAKTDELTGISNRRNFYDLAQREFNLAIRKQRKFSLLIMDIDYFKKINDNYGHLVGDIVIKTVANECVNNLRQEDLCARWGGEEFVVFLSETSLSEAMIVANRIRKNIESKTLNIESYSFNLTISVGVAEYNYQDNNLDSIVSRADEALFQAKNTGRNKVVLSELKS